MPLWFSQSVPDMLSSASAPGFSSKSFDSLTYCKRLLPFIAQQQPITYTKCIHLCEPWDDQEFFPSGSPSRALRGEPHGLCCPSLQESCWAPMGAAGADSNHPAQGQGAAAWSSEVQRRQPDPQQQQDPGRSLGQGEATQCLLAGVLQELGSYFLLKPTSPKKCHLSSLLQLRTCLNFTGSWLNGLNCALWGSPTSRIHEFSPAPMTRRLCIRNGVMGRVLAGEWGQVFVQQSRTLVSPTVELHPWQCCPIDGTDPSWL